MIQYMLQNFFGFAGGALMGISWLWQIHISNKANQSTVDNKFWLMRIIGLLFVTIHSFIIKDAAFSIINLFGFVIYGYNILRFKKNVSCSM